MRRLFRLITRYTLISAMATLEYRFDFFITAIVRLMESATSFLVIILLFSQINSLSGWSAPQVMMISITYSLSTALEYFLAKNSLKQLSENLNQGNIDRYLVKPIDFQLIISLGGFDWTQIFRFLFSVVAVFWLAFHYSFAITFGSCLLYILLIVNSAFIFYCLSTLIILLALYFGRIRNIHTLPYMFWDFGKFPTSIFQGFLGLVFSVIIPVASAATIPVGILVHKYSFLSILYIFLVSAIFFFLVRLSIHFGLRRYSSSSS